MNKLVAGFCLCFFLLSILSSAMDGSAGAAASTDLTQVASETDNHIHVTSTTGFLGGGSILYNGSEVMSYAALTPLTFTGLVRGIEDSEADSHAIGDAVYSEDLGIINAALGFRVVETGVTGGKADVLMIAWNFMTKTVPRIIFWDYAFLQGDLILLRYALMCVSVGFIVYLSFMAVNTIIGVLSKVI